MSENDGASRANNGPEGENSERGQQRCGRVLVGKELLGQDAGEISIDQQIVDLDEGADGSCGQDLATFVSVADFRRTTHRPFLLGHSRSRACRTDWNVHLDRIPAYVETLNSNREIAPLH